MQMLKKQRQLWLKHTRHSVDSTSLLCKYEIYSCTKTDPSDRSALLFMFYFTTEYSRYSGLHIWRLVLMIYMHLMVFANDSQSLPFRSAILFRKLISARVENKIEFVSLELPREIFSGCFTSCTYHLSHFLFLFNGVEVYNMKYPMVQYRLFFSSSLDRSKHSKAFRSINEYEKYF